MAVDAGDCDDNSGCATRGGIGPCVDRDVMSGEGVVEFESDEDEGGMPGGGAGGHRMLGAQWRGVLHFKNPKITTDVLEFGEMESPIVFEEPLEFGLGILDLDSF